MFFNAEMASSQSVLKMDISKTTQQTETTQKRTNSGGLQRSTLGEQTKFLLDEEPLKRKVAPPRAPETLSCNVLDQSS